MTVLMIPLNFSSLNREGGVILLLLITY